MTATGSSLERAFRDAAGAENFAGGEVDPLQLDMLRDDDGKLPANVFRMVRQGKAIGPGRPKGAGNKRNQKIAQMVCERFGDPVLGMASLYAMPLDQLVEMLRIADGAADREERLLQVADTAEESAKALTKRLAAGELTNEQVNKLTNLIDRLVDMAGELRSKPGALAVQALALQLQARKSVAEYVHGKQPVSVHIEGKADMVLLVPGLNAPIEASGELAAAVGKHGLDAIDFENMKLLPNLDGEEEGEQE